MTSEIAVSKLSSPEDPGRTLGVTDSRDRGGKGHNSSIFSHIPYHFSQEDDCHPATTSYSDMYIEN